MQETGLAKLKVLVLTKDINTSYYVFLNLERMHHLSQILRNLAIMDYCQNSVVSLMQSFESLDLFQHN